MEQVQVGVFIKPASDLLGLSDAEQNLSDAQGEPLDERLGIG